MTPDSSSTETAGSRPRFRLVVRAEPGCVPALIRLRRLLKGLLRGYGFRALEVAHLPESQPDGGSAAPARNGP
jgi:hypothetical protein